MEKKNRFLGIIAIITVIGFSMAGCPDPNNGGSGTPTTCTVTYNGNGNTRGTVPIDSNSPYQNGTTVTVLGNTGSLIKTGNTFAGWNTAVNGSGTSYSAGDTFTISVNTILYAQWTPIPRTVIYNRNGNTGGEVPTDISSPYPSGATVTVLGNTGSLVKTEYTFTGWNTAANGSGTSYSAGDTFTINNNTTLYAQWWREPLTATPLSLNTWIEGSLNVETEQWFEFSATATKNYIHLNYTGIGYAFVQVFTGSGIAMGSNQMLSSGTGNARPGAAGSIYRELLVGQKYYVRVQQAGDGTNYKGAYRIALTETSESPNLITLPTEDVVTLTTNTWADGETGSNKEQWYSFIANASTQYVHILPGTAKAFWIQMYGSNGGSIGNAVYSSGNGASGPWELEIGKKYFIKFPTTYWGTFQMAINTSTTPPPITLPTENVIHLTANTWADGTTDGGEWYKFTANSTTQYIHFNFTTATGASVKVYDSTGNIVGIQDLVDITDPLFSRELTNGSVYYLYVTVELAGGTFQIAYSILETPPAITLPVDGITILTANTWQESSGGYYTKQILYKTMVTFYCKFKHSIYSCTWCQCWVLLCFSFI